MKSCNAQNLELTTVPIPAVSLWDFFNSNSDLIAQISSCIYDAVRSFSQNDPLTILIILIIILQSKQQQREMEQKENVHSVSPCDHY